MPPASACSSSHRRGDRSTPTCGDRYEEGADQPSWSKPSASEHEQTSRRVMQGEKRASTPSVCCRESSPSACRAAGSNRMEAGSIWVKTESDSPGNAEICAS
uniref:Uncharacterized protein n=1 Tax=Oryza punctata TaxID=4537 RepID=A0A0E0L3S9_ORYPU